MVAGGGVMALLATGRLMQEVGLESVMVIVLETASGEENPAWLLLVSGPHLYAQVETPGRANLAWIVVRTCARKRLETPGTATLRHQMSEDELPVQAVKAICSITKSSRSATWRCFDGGRVVVAVRSEATTIATSVVATEAGVSKFPRFHQHSNSSVLAKCQPSSLLLLDFQIWQKDLSTMNAPLAAGPLRNRSGVIILATSNSSMGPASEVYGLLARISS